MKVFLCGDVMTGRGIDQILRDPCDPALHESFVRSATCYVRLAEEANGAVPRPVDFDYIWGAALEEWRRVRPDARIVNLETSITRSEDFFPKGINYRMSPENAPCLAAAGIDCCALANNHVLDWGRAGLFDTLETLRRIGIKVAGVGRDLTEAAAPAILDTPGEGRALVLSMAFATSGVPDDWAATADAPGVNLLPSLDEEVASALGQRLAPIRRPRDIVIASIHWGANWGYEVSDSERRFAHALIEQAGVTIVHGHSSHHPRPLEIFNDRLILYGCGDFLNDYEGIRGAEAYRGDLALMYFAEVDEGSGALLALDMTPLNIRRMQLARPSAADVEWLQDTLDRESSRFGVRIAQCGDGGLSASWPQRH